MADTVRAIAVSLSAPSLTVGQTATCKASVTTEVSDSQLDDNFPIAWSSSAPAVATVNAQGVVTAMGAGSATITASAGGVKGSAQVAVVALPAVTIDAVGQALIMALPVGSKFNLRGPTATILCQVGS